MTTPSIFGLLVTNCCGIER